MEAFTMEEKNDIANELEVYRAIKPYIAHCLTMNHEINNPLAGIIGYSEFLLEESESFTEDQVDYINKIITCADRIKNLVENLCEKKISLTEKVDMHSIVDEYKKVAKKLD